MLKGNEQVIREFFESWASGARVSALDEHLADDIRWVHSGLSDCTGKAACMELAAKHAQVFPVVEVAIRSLAVNGNAVLAERIDRLTRSDGSAPVDVEVSGSFRLRDGKIQYWHDYFDPRAFLPGG